MNPPNFEQLRTGIAEIVAICKDVPEEFRARCFEMLLGAMLQPQRRQVESDGESSSDNGTQDKDLSEDENDEAGKPNLSSLPGVVKAFLRKNDLAANALDKLVMVEGQELHFLKEPTHTNSRRGQNEWALLLALKNALAGKSFTVDPEDVRSAAQDKGFYDKSNFAANFKKEKYKGYYKGEMEPQGAAQGLSKEGEAALAELIKALTG